MSEGIDSKDEDENTSSAISTAPTEGLETTEDSMIKDDSEYQSSESSDAFEEFEDVNRLVVKISKEVLLEEPPEPEEPVPDPQIEIRSTPEKIDEESTQDDASSLKTEELTSKDTRDGVISVEEEALHREEDRREKMKILLTGYLEVKTKKEIEKALLNEKKIISQWLYPFRGAYQKEWALEMKKLKLGFQKALDYKKSHIHAIQRERKLVELNHLWEDSAHYRTTEELFDFMRMRCEKLKNRYLEDLEETKKYYLEREKEVVDKSTRTEDRARVLAFMRKNVHDQRMRMTQDTLDNFKLEGEYLRDKEAETVREKHLTYVEMIAKELQTSISPPEHRMDEIREVFEEWKGKYQEFLKTTEKNRRELAQFGEEIPALEAKVQAARRRLEDLRVENKITKQKENEDVARLKKIAKRYSSLQPALRKMISSSEDVMTKLRERKGMLDKIMKLKKICDQLEYESEAIFPPKIFEEEEGEDENDAATTTLVRKVCSDNIEDQSLLRSQHRKISLVQMQNQYLLTEIHNLRLENMSLRSDMKKYLHLITSGEWQRVPDEEFKAMMYYGSMMTTKEGGTEEGEADPHFERNLELLNRNCRHVNDQIIERIEKMK